MFDDQLHVVRSSIRGPTILRALAQGPTAPEDAAAVFNPGGFLDELGSPWSPWNPDLVDQDFPPDMFHLVQFIKDVYLDSQVTVGVLSNITGFITNGIPRNVIEARDLGILTAAQTAGVRNFINRIAGSTRILAHGLLYPHGRGPPHVKNSRDSCSTNPGRPAPPARQEASARNASLRTFHRSSELLCLGDIGLLLMRRAL